MGTAKRKRAVFRRLGLDLREGVRFKLADGFYRMRRGKLVRIPDEWVGRPTECCGDILLRRLRKRRYPRASEDVRKRRMQDTESRQSGYSRVPRDRFERAKKKGKKQWHRTGGHPRNWAPRHCLGGRLRRLHGWDEDE